MNGPPTNAPSVIETRVWCSITAASSSLGAAPGWERPSLSTADDALGPKYLSDHSARCSGMNWGSAQSMRSTAGAS